MPTIIEQLEGAFRTAIAEAAGVEADPQISVSQNEKFGDYQANVAMGLAKLVAETTGRKTNPRAVAEQIVAKLKLGELAEEVTIAGPGFINLKLSPAWVARQIERVASDPRLGVQTKADPQIVVVDYSGPNVAKEMHVGHLRSTIIGDAISRVLEFQGDEVIRQNHIGDWGTQFGMLISYLFADEGYGHSHVSISDLEDFYRRAKKRFDEDAKFQDEARKAVVRLQAGSEKELQAWRLIVDETRRNYQPIYDRLAIRLRPEDERGESAYNNALPGIVADLKPQNLAVESEGATVVFVDGTDKTPLMIEKTGGGYLYGTTDLAAIRYRVDRLHARRIIYTHDSRQAQHFAMVFAVAKKAGWADGVSLEYAPFGTMLGEDGRPFKSRSGEVVKLKDLLDEAEERALAVIAEKTSDLDAARKAEIAHAVGIGAVKYSDLSKDRVSDYVFSWEKMLSFDGNTAPYLQNAYVRIQSIFRRAGGEPLPPHHVELNTPHELSLAKHLLRLADVIESVARELKPHLLATYLYELATKFHSFYEHCPVLTSQEPTRASRLALCKVVARTLALGLDLLGIEHPDQM